MHSLDERLMSQTATGPRSASRRGVIASAGVAAAAALVANATRLAPPVAAQDDATGEDIISVLNYALTLEHLENSFYRDGLATFTVDAFTALGFQPSVLDYVVEIGAHELAHVETLTQVVTDLGGTPVTEGEYDFAAAYADLPTFLATGQALEDTGVGAYQGAAQYLIENDGLLTAALTIHGVEARHAAYLAVLNDGDPFPEAFNPTLTPAEVVEIAGPFIVAADVVLPSAAGTGGAGGEATPVA